MFGVVLGIEGLLTLFASSKEWRTKVVIARAMFMCIGRLIYTAYVDVVFRAIALLHPISLKKRSMQKFPPSS